MELTVSFIAKNLSLEIDEVAEVLTTLCGQTHTQLIYSHNSIRKINCQASHLFKSIISI